MIENIERVGSFTSSKISVLCKDGKGKETFSAAALTYINERRIERKLMRSCDTKVKSRDMLWGLAMEMYVDTLLDEFGYSLVSQVSRMHPEYIFWAGSADFVKARQKVGDSKCYKPKNFAILTDAILSHDIEIFKKSCPDEYWQLVSNAIIHQVPNAEIISFMPSIEQLPLIADFLNTLDYKDYQDQIEYGFIHSDIVNERYERLPYLPINSDYSPLNRFEFEVPEKDKSFLTKRVLQAEEYLQNLNSKYEKAT